MKKFFLIFVIIFSAVIFHFIFNQIKPEENNVVKKDIRNSNSDYNVSPDIFPDVSVDMTPSVLSLSSPDTEISFTAPSNIFYYQISCIEGMINRSESKLLSIDKTTTYSVSYPFEQDLIQVSFYDEQLLLAGSLSIHVKLDEKGIYHFQTMKLEQPSVQNN